MIEAMAHSTRHVLEDAGDRRRLRRLGRVIMGTPIGIQRLDDLTNGLRRGFIVLAGPPGVGKTTLSLQIGLQGHSKIGTTIEIYSHEMPGEDASAAAMLE